MTSIHFKICWVPGKLAGTCQGSAAAKRWIDFEKNLFKGEGERRKEDAEGKEGKRGYKKRI